MRPAPRLIMLAALVAFIAAMAAVLLPEGGSIAFGLWTLLCLAALVDIVLTPGTRRMALEAQMPEQGFVGSEAPLTLRVEGQKGLPSRVDLKFDHNDILTSQGELDPLYPDGASMEATVPLRLTARGHGELRSIWLRYGSRLGLFEMLPHWPTALTINVLADSNPVLSGEITTQMLPLLDGQKSAQMRGDGSEFHQLRDYQPDQDPRSIDWKRSARMRSLVARETRSERNHQIMLCLDSGHLMGQRIGTLTRFDRALNAALALAWAGGLGGDQVGFYTFGSRPGLFVPPRPGRKAFGLIRAESASLFPEDAQTNHTLGLSHLNSQLSRRGLVVVFSDFSDSVTVDLLVENLAVIARHHLVLYIALRDPDLEALGSPDQSTLSNVARAVAARQAIQERAEVLERLTRLGVLCLDTSAERLTPALVSRYIDIKAQELI